MSKVRRRSPRPTVVLRHTKDLADESTRNRLVRRLMHECGRGGLNPVGEPMTAQDEEEWFQRWKNWDSDPTPLSFLPTVRFHFPRRGPPTPAGIRRAEVTVSLQVPPSRQLSNTRTAEYPRLRREPLNWVDIGGNSRHMNHEDPEDMAWFLGKARCMLSHFDPDFAFAETDVVVAKRLASEEVDPRRLVWPLLVYGPETVQDVGRDRLLKAPAWKVEELEYGGVWVQATENPFVATKRDLKPLAKHLELEVPA